MHLMMKKELSQIKQLLGTMFILIKIRTGFATDIVWMNTTMCSVTCELSQSSSNRVVFFKESSALLDN